MMRSYADSSSREITQSTINSSSKSELIRSKVQSALEHIWKRLFEALAGNHEVQVRQVRDRFGKSHWTVYDPFTERRSSLSSEAEVRSWLEQRYSL